MASWQTTRGTNSNAALMLWNSAERAGDHPAIRDAGESYSFDVLRGRAAAVAAAATASGVEPGDRVAIFLERGFDAAAAYFGVWAAGGVAIMVNETVRVRQLDYILEHSGARLLVTSASALVRLHRPHSDAVAVLRVDELPACNDFIPVPRDSNQLAQITYTSGSTGLPKGVMATHGNVLAAIETVAGYLGLDENDRVASALPFSSVYGANQLLCAVLVGAELLILRSPVANQIASDLRAMEATVLAGVPPFWMQLLAAPEFRDHPIPSLRVIQNAGGHLAPAAGQQLRAVQPQARIFLQYGMTEVFRSTFLSPEDFDSHPESMGKPMPGVEILLVRDDLTPCDVNEVGQLVHAGPTVTLGYWNEPERTATVYRPHPLRPDAPPVVFSGDMVRRDADGFLYFVGRSDRMIKTLGYRVGPDEIQDVLYASGEIAEGIVTTEPDAQRGERIVAYVVLRPEGSLSRLKMFCRTELPRYMQPARIDALETIPRTTSGKHDLIALRERMGVAGEKSTTATGAAR